MNENMKGGALMVAAMAFFAIEDMFIKLVAAHLPLGQIVLVLGGCGAAIFLLLARVRRERIFTKDALHPIVLARNFGEVVGTWCFMIAISDLPLALVLAVLQALPLVVTMGAALFMGESVGWRRWTAISVGFVGVLLVIRPGTEGFNASAIWLLISVLGLGLRDLVSRALPHRLSNTQVSAWGQMAVALMGAVMVWQGGLVPVAPPNHYWLAGGVVFGTAGYLVITTAARMGEVSIVAPFRYVRLVFAMAIGALVFAERPDALTQFGAALIVGSGLYSFLRERARARARARTAR